LPSSTRAWRRRSGSSEPAAPNRPDAHDYSESETRDYVIDLLLKEAGWALDQPRDREFDQRNAEPRRHRLLFTSAQVEELLAVLDHVRATAAAA
jgi:hypothetical protein